MSTRRRPPTRRVASLVAVAMLLTVPVYLTEAVSATPTPGTLTANQLGFMDHIDHIVYVVMENHAYDSYFGTYCTAVGPHCPNAANGLPSSTCVPYNVSNLSGLCIRPWNYTAKNWTMTTPLPHSWVASHAAWNNGSMNGFYAAESSGLDPFGHYNGTTEPIMWDLAQEYALSDNFFSSVLSYSLPNHWHIIAGQSPQIVVINGTLGKGPAPANKTIANDRTYLSQANTTKSVEDLLLRSSVSWRYYDYALGPYANAIRIGLNANGSQIVSTGLAYNAWNPQAAKAESYNRSFVQHFAANTQFFGDARNGTLPNISWLIPPPHDSGHASQNETLSQSWLASVVDAVESSPEWNSTALYITWDDYGGYYDHVAPPTFRGQQLALRVPLLIISPYTRPGTVPHAMGFFESVLHLMEWRFHLHCITSLDCNAPLPLFAFNWSKPARAPILFPTNFSQASYPYNASWNGSALVRAGTYYPPPEFVGPKANSGLDVD